MHHKHYDIEVSVTVPPHADNLCSNRNKLQQSPIDVLVELLYHGMAADPYYKQIMDMDLTSIATDRKLTLKASFETSREILILNGSNSTKSCPIGLAWWIADCHGMALDEMLCHILFTAPQAMKRNNQR